jgi:hypothetical protein
MRSDNPWPFVGHKPAMTCPHCHRTERVGAPMSALKAAIFDRIRRAGDIGVTSEEIRADVYGDRRPVSATTIKSHVWQINELLVDGDAHITSDRRRWFLERRR